MGQRPFTGPALLTILLTGFIVAQLPMAWSAFRAARARGFAWKQLAGALMRQPGWWIALWYPRRFRRAGDVWDRLPGPIRAWRIIVTALCVDFVLCVYILIVVVPLAYPARDLVLVRLLGANGLAILDGIERLAAATPFPAAFVALFLLLGAALAVTAVLCARFMRGQGLDTYTLRRLSHTLIVGSTAQRSLWKNPAVARVLLPARALPTGEPRTPREVVSALTLAAGRLAEPLRGAVQEAAAAAGGLAGAIHEQDAAIVRLSRHADPGEAARLRERLAALQTAGDPESAEMAALLARQLSLLDDAAARLAAAQSSRGRLLAALMGLWRVADGASGGPVDAERLARLSAAIGEAKAAPARLLNSSTEDATVTKG